jgi:hypothetical protein
LDDAPSADDDGHGRRLQQLFRSAIPNHSVCCLSGIQFSNFFSQSITTSMLGLRGYAGTLQKGCAFRDSP